MLYVCVEHDGEIWLHTEHITVTLHIYHVHLMPLTVVPAHCTSG